MKTKVLAAILVAFACSAFAQTGKPQVTTFMHQTLGESMEDFMRISGAKMCASQKPQAAQWCETFKKIQAGEKGVVTDSNGAASVSLVFAEKRLVQVLVEGKADWGKSITEFTQKYGAPDVQTANAAEWAFGDGGGISVNGQPGNLFTATFFSKDAKPTEKKATAPATASNMPMLMRISGAIPPPSIKGHFLGESISTFGQGSGQPSIFETCKNKLSEPVPKKKRDNGMLSVKDLELKRRAQEREQCEVFLRAVNSGDRLEEVIVPGTSLGRATFNKNVLVKLSMDVAEDSMLNVMRTHADQVIPPSYDEVLNDLIKKIGQPTNQTDYPAQNGYGAIFHHRLATWERPEFFATVFEVKVGGVAHDGRITTSSVQVTIETPEERRIEIARQNNRPSSLD
jgi:hypothetical protein